MFGFVNKRRGSATPVVLVALTLVIILALVIVKRPRDRQTPLVPPQTAAQGDTRALYIAQTALDRSVKALAADPGWRSGFEATPFEDGTYDVRVFEHGDSARTLPPNYVRIVAKSNVGGVTSEVEAVWVDAMAAFRHAMTAGNRIELLSHDANHAILPGSIHNNASRGGKISIGSGVTVYGDVTSLGDVEMGSNDVENTVVFGSVWGSSIRMSGAAAIRDPARFGEWEDGIDLNRDGDLEDRGEGGGKHRVSALTAITVDGRSLGNGDMDRSLGGGATSASVGGESIGAIFEPRPDFAAFYELVTGSYVYPPRSKHVTTPLAGDGDGHYFASGDGFIAWLDAQPRGDTVCWRCAGDQRIDPGNGTECPTCAGTGYVAAVVASGVFYVDDALCDLSGLGADLVLHGTIVVADGDPYRWPEKRITSPGGDEVIDHFPTEGKLVLRGEHRSHFTQTYRSSGGERSYRWRRATIFNGENTQTIALPVAHDDPITDFPALVVADEIDIAPRGRGFAYHPGDIGDEKVTMLEGVVYAENRISLHGRGGWEGEPVVFEEELPRAEDESLDESVFNVDLNGDGDMNDRVTVGSIQTVPAVPVSRDEVAVDINNDGVLANVPIGGDYVAYFNENAYVCPVLIYHSGVVLSQEIHACEQTFVIADPAAARALPFGFALTFGAAPHQGLISWKERTQDKPQ